MTSCSKSKVSYQGDWSGKGLAIIQNDLYPDDKDSTGLKINFDNVILTINKDTFEITGLDKKFKGIFDANPDTTTIDLLDFDSYEYETHSRQDEIQEKGTITVQVSGGQPLTGETIWLEDDNSIILTFYRNRYEDDSRFYELKLKMNGG